VADQGREVVVITRKEDYHAQENLLHKILSAAKLEVNGQVTFIELEASEKINLSDLSPAVENVFCFGLKPSQVGFNASFQGYHFYKTETFSILFSHKLSDLAQKPEKKKALWTAMQKQFLTPTA